MGGGKLGLRTFFHDYLTEIIFGIALSALVVTSYFLSPLIHEDLYRRLISPMLYAAILFSSATGAWSLMRHNGGLRVRKLAAAVSLTWAVLITLGMCVKYQDRNSLDAAEGLLSMKGWEFVFGDFLAWLLLVYPTETLRPKWLTWKKALYFLLPVLFTGIIDYFCAVDLRWLLTTYPVVLFIVTIFHIHAYRVWCENNYSSMDNIDVQWIVRYLIMLFIAGASFYALFYLRFPTRLFTQQWLILFILTYANDQILFRHDPWADMEETDPNAQDAANKEHANNQHEYTLILEQWMEKEKPYLNPNFKLTDLNGVLPLNRTYISQFINKEYNCNFYQFVSKYRIEEAKRLMRENPNAKMYEIALKSGFSSPTIFGRIFARETGETPTKWMEHYDNT